MSTTGASASTRLPTSKSIPGEGMGAVMTVHVRLFAILRERAEVDQVEIELRAGATVADALRALSELEPFNELLDRLPVHMAVNRDYATPEMVLGPDDELALIPPLSGGSPQLTMPNPPASAAGQQGHGQ